jgi:hypothetical protein
VRCTALQLLVVLTACGLVCMPVSVTVCEVVAVHAIM